MDRDPVVDSLDAMSPSWNFERRRVVCGAFVVGVSVVAKGKPGVLTSLEAVRSRMRLPPEDALFAARRLHEDQLIEFEAGGAVRSTDEGIRHADGLVRAAVSKVERFEEVSRTVAGGGVALAMLRTAILAHGGTLACGAPDGSVVAHRLALREDLVTIERKTAEGTFEPASPDEV